MVANASSWKREEPEVQWNARMRLSKKPAKKTPTVSGESAQARMSKSKQVHAPPKAVDKDECVKDMPLPKWLFGGNITSDPATHATTPPSTQPTGSFP